MKSLLLPLCFTLFIVACDTKSAPGDRGMVMDEKQMSMPPSPDAGQTVSIETPTSGTAQPDVIQQKIIRNGTMNISVKDARKARKELDDIIKKYKAYIGNEQLDNTDYQTSYHLQLRIPAASLDSLVAALEAMDGTVTFKSINARDVTEEYIDIQTRLTNKRAYLDQYRQILKNAHTVEDILKVQEQIRALQEEIESTEGRLKYLTNQVDLSTLDLTIIQQKDYVFKPERKVNFIERLKESLAAGWYGFMDFIIGFIGLWPFLIVIAALLWIWRRSSRRKKQSK